MNILLTVVIVLGIIIAGGFLLYFAGDLILSAFSPKRDQKVIEKNRDAENKKVEEKLAKMDPEMADEARKSPELSNLVYGGAVVEAYNPEEDEEATETEEVAETEEVTETPAEETEEDDDRDAYIEQRRRELMEHLARLSQDDEEEADEEEEEAEEETAEGSDETLDLDEETEEVVEDSATETEEDVAAARELEEARKALAEIRAQNEALQRELNAAKDEMAKAPVAAEEPVMLSEEDYLARLAELEETLKANEKELRACKKEYIPLRKVKRSLENDGKKLRRKEALVAKQKVVLYGVNNYADIDEEKAKKLAEDLDHLDGLKLSVQHCQEVMDKNADRYPLLEKMFNILTAQNEELKASIARTNAELAILRGEGDTTTTEE